MTSTIVDAVISYWDGRGVKYLAGVTDREIEDFEKKHTVTLPQDMAYFYKRTDGTHAPGGNEMDPDLFDFYPLAQITPDSNYRWAFTFVDYCLLSWWYAIDLRGGGDFRSGAVYLMGAVGGLPLLVADSFSQFLDCYLRKDERLNPQGASEFHEARTAESESL